MRNDLDYYRKFQLRDYSLNTKKFKEYCEYCKKSENTSEKKRILESIITHTNTVSISNDIKKKELLEGLTNLSANAIIYTDFEIESFLEIPNFSINFQKQILISSINICYDRNKETMRYIQSKFQFWVILTTNYQLKQGFDNILTKEEISISIETLEKEINDFNNIEDVSNLNNIKILLIKAAYELGFYYMLYSNYIKCKTYYNFVYENYIENYSFYFDIDNIKLYLNYINKNYLDKDDDINIQEKDNIIINNKLKNNNNNNDHNSDFDISKILKNFINELKSSKNELYNKFDFLDGNQDMHNILSEINKSYTTNLDIDELSKSLADTYKINLTNYIEIYSNNIQEVLLTAKTSIINTILNESNSSISGKIIKKIHTLINYKQSDNSDITLDDNISIENQNLIVPLSKNIQKDIAYFSLIQYMLETNFNDTEDKLKDFLKELSNLIVTKDLPSDKDISQCLQLLLINYDNHLTHINKYFSDFSKYLANLKFEEKADMMFIYEVINILIMHKSKKDISLSIINNINTKENNYFNNFSNTANINYNNTNNMPFSNILYYISLILDDDNSNFLTLIGICVKILPTLIILQHILLIYLKELINCIDVISKFNNSNNSIHNSTNLNIIRSKINILNKLQYTTSDMIEDSSYMLNYFNLTNKIIFDCKFNIIYNFKSFIYGNNHFIKNKSIEKLTKDAMIIINLIINIEDRIYYKIKNNKYDYTIKEDLLTSYLYKRKILLYHINTNLIDFYLLFESANIEEHNKTKDIKNYIPDIELINNNLCKLIFNNKNNILTNNDNNNSKIIEMSQAFDILRQKNILEYFQFNKNELKSLLIDYFRYVLEDFKEQFQSLEMFEPLKNDSLYYKLKNSILSDNCLVILIEVLINTNKILEPLFLCQYNIDKIIIKKFSSNNPECVNSQDILQNEYYLSRTKQLFNKNFMLNLIKNSDVCYHNELILDLLYKIPFIESLGCIYYEANCEEKLNKLENIMKKLSVHQFNSKTAYKRAFKLFYFLKFFYTISHN